ncbi:MAG: DUF1987 domain-containing protein [Bacteroidales bacterium]|nr:DUF1987 domain-containing protein [Bacteroidales bacterium]
MQSLIIKKTEETPAIILNPEKKVFQFVATSWPENAKLFYEPVLKWIDDYFKNSPLDESVFQFRYGYFNTSSAKQIAKILSLLKEHSSKHSVKIQWFFEKDDFDMEKEGRRFEAILKLDFDFVEK